MYRKEKKYSIDEVFNFIESHIVVQNYKKYRNDKSHRRRHEFDGDMMKPWSLRYFTFIKKGCTCAGCGIEATHFYKEHNREEDPYHFNLYGLRVDGTEVMFTKDHNNPKSKGGVDQLKNFVTMCKDCNSKKADMTPDDWNRRKR